MIRETGLLYGLMCKTRFGQQRMQGQPGEILPGTFPQEPASWWWNSDDGIAMYAPQLIASEDASVTSAFNCVGRPCELTNLQETCAGRGDLLVRSFLRKGPIALSDMNGEFAIAFWHAERKELLLARDHFGQRTLFLREDEDFIYYCSELEPLLADPLFQCRLDVESAFRYLAFGQPVAGRTLARGISKVLAAHCIIWKSHQTLFCHRYYSPLRHDAQKVLDESGRDQIARVLDHAINRRTLAGKQALLLSGGVDSSYLAATIRAKPDQNRLDAYTIAFSGLDAANETEYAALVARKFEIELHVVSLAVDQAAAILEKVLTAAEPCSAWATITHQHLISQISSEGHNHLFSGLGADEVFGGYGSFLRHYARLRSHQANWTVPNLIDATDGIMWNPIHSRVNLFPGVPRFFDDASLRSALYPPFSSWNFTMHDIAFYRECRKQKSDAHLFELMVSHECQHRIPDLLFSDFEPISRQSGIRSVYPFLDPKVVELAIALGATERFSRESNRMWKNKKALREIAAMKIPDQILQRRPVSYNAPFLSWMEARRFAEPVLSRLQESRFWDVGLIRRSWLDRLKAEIAACFTKPKSTKLKFVYQLWVVLTLVGWYDRWVEHRGLSVSLPTNPEPHAIK
jgi:asparagine synthase (glutamine-hydrolysing)